MSSSNTLAYPGITSAKRDIGYELHQPARRNYYRRDIRIHGFRDLFSADLIDMQSYSEENDDYRFILLVICCFSKYVFCRPLKTKLGAEVAEAMQSILLSREKKFLKPPKYLHVDRGPEFHCTPFKKMLAKFNTSIYSTGSNVKASIAERAIRTLKGLMFREFSIRGSHKWIDILDILTKQYNNTPHRTIKMVPAKVGIKDESRLQNIYNLYHASKKRGKVKFHLGDTVRISKIKGVFEKGYLPNWSTELFKIKKVCNTCPVTYELKDFHGKAIKGGFYNEEIQKTSYPDDYLVEKVIKKRGNRHYVKFLGFPSKDNAWINASDYV